MVWLGDRLIATFDINESDPDYIFTDHIGYPLMVMDSSASPLWSAVHEPYGEAVLTGGTAAGDPLLRYPGQWKDDPAFVVTDPPQRNLFANGYRWYNPDWGRYTQSDPMGLVDDNVEPYAYASSNPLLYTDPDGLLVIPAGSGCRALKPKRLARWLSRLANNDECSSYFCDMFGTDLGTLLSPNSPPFLVLREGHGGGYRWSRDHYDPSPIYVGRAHCNNASDFFHVVVHELGHFADYQRGDWMQNEEDGCGAEVACFGNTIGANCMALGYPP